jgi:hypothetical protein
MLSQQPKERCPQCSYDGYCYDNVCRVWCCGRCFMMETPREKSRRAALSARAGTDGLRSQHLQFRRRADSDGRLLRLPVGPGERTSSPERTAVRRERDPNVAA